jgi:hypothetical protein
MGSDRIYMIILYSEFLCVSAFVLHKCKKEQLCHVSHYSSVASF